MRTITITIDSDDDLRMVTQQSGPPAWRVDGTKNVVSYPFTHAKDLCEPLRDDQRAALFAAFVSVFRTQDIDARHLFTRVVLGKNPDEGASWSRAGHHTKNSITAAEASVLLNALNGYERVQSLYG